ncbi:tyrosine-protein kinase SRK2-like isoform X2 [Penaeus chinensis]|uniref:tyrosine-protein kinase SRK2-like isoform X2 n=1 Tax=Penaeus chinensis TaxID=139456 RepID=UPI001FB8597C|nr:tyrosine-protein kinase SRK2-like isoform X2 [Penaeus chinensis]
MAFIFKTNRTGQNEDPDDSIYMALYEFTATKADELDFVEGDKLVFLNKTDGGWLKARNLRSLEEGYVPSNFVQKRSENVSHVSQNVEDEEDKPLITYAARYDYNGTEAGTLSFKKGDKMVLLSKTNEHWWRMRLQKTSKRSISDVLEGYVRPTYISKVEDPHEEPWFFDNISRAEAMMLLLSDLNMPGSFLVRRSKSSDGFSLSVLTNSRRVKHYRITENEEGNYFVTENTVFSSLKELVEYYLCSYNPPGRLGEPCKASEGSLSKKHLPGAQAVSHSEDDTTEWEIDRNSLTFTAVLGKGQFGKVQQAQWKNKVDVAVKSITSGAAEKKEFEREVKVMQRLRHPLLVKLYGVCTTPLDKPLLIVSELVTGGSLLIHLRNKKAQKNQHTMKELLHIGAKVASGMAYLESEQVVHRDLAARNVLVASDGKVVKIADFGLSRILQDGVYRRRSDYKIPMKWTAPEAFDQGHYTCKSDVWSYGILLHELITHGNQPYPELNNKEAIFQVCNGHRMGQARECPDNLYQVMCRCWQEDPAERPSFAELKPRMEYLESLH